MKLGGDIELTGSLTLEGEFETDGYHIQSNDYPITVGSLPEALSISGASTLTLTVPVGSSRINRLTAPDTTVVLASSYGYLYGSLDVESFTNDSLLRVAGNYTVTADHITNNGSIESNSNYYYRTVYLRGDINSPGDIGKRIRVRIGWENDHNAYEYKLTPSRHTLSSAQVYETTDNYSLDIRGILNSTQQYYFTYRPVSTNWIGNTTYGRWSPVRTINAPPETPVAPDYFAFDIIEDITLPQKATVVIESRDASFSGRGYLSVQPGDIYPSVIDFTDGLWEGEVAFFTQAVNTQIRITSEHHAGVSNYFTVFPASTTQQTGMLWGTVEVGSSDYTTSIISELTGTEVTITDERGTTHTAVLEKRGIFSELEFTANDLPCGSYQVQIPAGDSYRAVNSTVQVSCGAGVTVRIGVSAHCNENDLVPVLLVPGIMGSDYTKRPSVFARLPEYSPEWNDERFHLHNTGDATGVFSLIESLERTGYQQGCTIHTVPYDWTLSNTDSASRYLAPWINYAKELSGQEQVDIVAHSMGGLVARSYIQGDDYQQDVRKLIMVGTPNQGSMKVYFAWEGGDAMAASYYGFDGGWTEYAGITDHFQAKTLNINYKTRTGSPIDLCDVSIPVRVLEYDDLPGLCDQELLKDFVRSQVPSIGQLYPTEDFLYYMDGTPVTPTYENTFLKALNGQPCTTVDCGAYSFTPYQERLSVDTSGVQTYLLYGDKSRTPEYIYLYPNSGSEWIYPDGVPKGVTYSEEGDNTVLSRSVLFDGRFIDNFTVDNGHTRLFRSTREQIISWLNE